MSTIALREYSFITLVTVDQKEKKSNTFPVSNPLLGRENSQPKFNALSIKLSRHRQLSIANRQFFSIVLARLTEKSKLLRDLVSVVWLRRRFDLTSSMFYFIKRLKIIVETFLKKAIKEFLKICQIVLVSCRSLMLHKVSSRSKTNLKKLEIFQPLCH